MFAQLELSVLGATQTIFDQFGWLGVFAMLVFENATGLTPSELILGLAGWMLIEAHGIHPSMIFLGGLYAALGSMVGSSIAYWVARLGGRPVVERFARLFHITPEQITMSEQQFHRWGFGLVCFGRIVPGVRTLVSLPAGLARMPFGAFLLATFTGAYVWCTLLLGVGYFLGVEWPLISHYLKEYFPYIVSVGILGLTGFAMYIYRKSWIPFLPFQKQTFEREN